MTLVNAAKGSVDENKTYREAANEMVNDCLFALFTSEEGLNDLIDWSSKNMKAENRKSFLQRIADFFDDLIKYISNYLKAGNFNAAEKAMLEMDAKRAKALRKKVLDAMNNVSNNAKGENVDIRKSVYIDNQNTVVIKDPKISKSQVANNPEAVEQFVYEQLLTLAKQNASAIIKADNRTIYFDEVFADEYTHSNDTINYHNREKRAKLNAAEGVLQIIERATNPRPGKNKKISHNVDAKRGWFYYDVNFGIEGNENITYFSGVLNVRLDANGKDYAYDITDIKKGRVAHLAITKSNAYGQYNRPLGKNIKQNANKVNSPNIKVTSRF